MMKKRFAQAGWILTWMALWIMTAQAAAPTITKRLIYREDIAPGYGTATVPTSTGGTMTVNKLNYSVLGGPWFDVREYGALGDGSNDDAPAIDNAYDACEAAGGGTVFLPPGVFNLASYSTHQYSHTAYITPRSNCNLIGSGRASVLRVADGQFAAHNGTYGPNVITTNSPAGLDNAIFRDFAIDENLDNKIDGVTVTGVRNAIGIGSVHYSGRNIIVENILFKNMIGNQSIMFQTDPQVEQTPREGFIWVNANEFYNVGKGIAGNDGAGSAGQSSIYLDGDHLMVTNNIADAAPLDNTGTLMSQDAFLDWHGSHKIAANNDVKNYKYFAWEFGRYEGVTETIYDGNIHKRGAMFVASRSSDASYIWGTISYFNNTFTQHPTITNEAYIGVIGGVTGGSPADLTIDTVKMVNNTFKGVGINTRGFLVGRVRNFTFMNNTVEGLGGDIVLHSRGDVMADGYSFHTYKVEGNTFRNNAGTAVYTSAADNILNFSVKNNTVHTDNALASVIAFAIGAVLRTGEFIGNLVTGTYFFDFQTTSGADNLFIQHTATNGYHTASAYGRVGSTVYFPANFSSSTLSNSIHTKTVTGSATGWRFAFFDNSIAGHPCNDPYWAGSTIFNNGAGTDNTSMWYCNGSTWFPVSGWMGTADNTAIYSLLTSLQAQIDNLNAGLSLKADNSAVTAALALKAPIDSPHFTGDAIFDNGVTAGQFNTTASDGGFKWNVWNSAGLTVAVSPGDCWGDGSDNTIKCSPNGTDNIVIGPYTP